MKNYKILNQKGVDIVHLESPPRVTCFSEKVNTPIKCRTSSDTIFQRQVSEAKIQVARSMNFKVVDTTFWFCSPSLVCPNQIGNMFIKQDGGHFTGNLSRMLGSILRDEILIKNN